MTVPRRFVLDSETLAGALAFAGIQPDPASGLPMPREVARPMLEGAGILQGGALEPSLAEGLMVAAAPGRFLRVWANGAGRPAWVQTRLFSSSDSDAVVALAERDGEFDIAVLGTHRQAVLLIDELLGITDLVAGAPEGRHDLSLNAYVALLASADLLQFATLMTRLERVMRRPPPVLTPDGLVDLVEKGLEGLDTRWAVTAAATPAPVSLAMNGDQIRRGIIQLQQAGLVEDAGPGPTLTGDGFQIASDLNQIIGTGSLSLSIPTGNGTKTAAPVTIFRCATAIWGVVWHGSGDDVAVTLIELDHDSALGIVEKLLRDAIPTEPRLAPSQAAAPPASEPEPRAFCSGCGTEFRAGRRFCATCGKTQT